MSKNRVETILSSSPTDPPKSHWNPLMPPPCRNCGGGLIEKGEDEQGTFAFWCRNCGTLFTPNRHEPISMSDWHYPRILNKKE